MVLEPLKHILATFVIYLAFGSPVIKKYFFGWIYYFICYQTIH